MAYKEIEIELKEAKKWVKDLVVEGKLESVQDEVGEHNSKIFTIAGEEYWGANALNGKMSQIKIGQKVRVTCIDEARKFDNGRVGKDFKVEVEQ